MDNLDLYPFGMDNLDLCPFDVRVVEGVRCPKLNDYLNYVRYVNSGVGPYPAVLFWQDTLSVFRDNLYNCVRNRYGTGYGPEKNNNSSSYNFYVSLVDRIFVMGFGPSRLYYLVGGAELIEVGEIPLTSPCGCIFRAMESVIGLHEVNFSLGL